MIIHTIGDSHSEYGWNAIDGVVIHNIGIVTMASFGLNWHKLINIQQLGIKEKDTIVFCFGEVDRRCHLCKPNNIVNYQNLVDYIIDKYFIAIQESTKGISDLKIMVYNVVPPMFMGEPDYKLWGEGSGYQYPFIGSNEDIKMVTLYMNEKIKEFCNQYNYTFFDVYEDYCNANGFLNDELRDVSIHIQDPRYIIKFLNK
jgi:hypothetical protein